jgi:hypothetical protein
MTDTRRGAYVCAERRLTIGTRRQEVEPAA